MADNNTILEKLEGLVARFEEVSTLTYFATVGLGLPEVLALGAAIYPPLYLISFCAAGCEGIRIATVSRPPVVS